MGCLDEYVIRCRELGRHREAKAIGLLRSSSPDAAKVQDWLKKNARKGIGQDMRLLPNCEDWEAELWFLSFRFADFRPMGVWETACGKTRLNHANRVATLCRELADTLDSDIRPYYPPALEFFEPERAVDIIRSLPKSTAEALLSATGFSLDLRNGYKRGKPEWFENGEPGYRDPASILASRYSYPESQKVSSLLRRLADYAEACPKKPKRDQRPSFPNQDARAFARELSDFFNLFFKKHPNEVIAACVALKFPELDPPPDEAAIRKWRGKK